MNMPPEMRPTCLRCLRTAADCYCGRIRPFVSGPRFVILQHPKEFRNRMGSARMARLCVLNSILVAGDPAEREERTRALVSEPGTRAVLLYPGPGALELDQAFAPGTGAGTLTIFVIDATWA